jgi:hypothetical protein
MSGISARPQNVSAYDTPKSMEIDMSTEPIDLCAAHKDLLSRPGLIAGVDAVRPDWRADRGAKGAPVDESRR